MPAVFVPGGPYLYPNTVPVRLINYQVDGAGGTAEAFFPNETGGFVLICGIDATATGDPSSGPIDCDFTLNGTNFYHDSQSIGEGRGITFSWRGMHILKDLEDLQVFMHLGVNTANVGFLAWGLVMTTPFDYSAL